MADAQKMKAKLYSIDISFTILATIAVALRLWARGRSAGNYGWDDFLVVLSMFLMFANFAMNAIMIENNLGLQATEVPLNNLIMIGKAIYADEIIYVVNLALIKIAILVMYCRVFPVRSFRVAASILGTITVIWSLMFIFICIFQCSPIPRAWNLTIPGKCLYLRGVFIGNAVPNIITDAAILAMPMYHVWHLQVRKAQRVALTCIFLLGAFVIVASIYRFTTILKLNPLNLSYTLKTPTTWSHVEVTVALISACLPTMRPLLTALLDAVGMHRTVASGGGDSKEYESNSGWSGKKIRAEKSTFEVLENREACTTPTKSGTNDEMPLNVIQVQREYEQTFESSPKSDGWVDGRRKSWYPS